MDNLDLSRILNLCRLGREGLIQNYPELSKYVTSISSEPKPISELEKRIRSRGEEVQELYYSLPNNPDAIYEIYEFSEVLRAKYGVRLESARKIHDPAEQSKRLAETFGEIRTDIIRALGLVDAIEQKELSRDERFDMALQFGRRYFGI